jgi:hypothetical protein
MAYGHGGIPSREIPTLVLQRAGAKTEGLAARGLWYKLRNHVQSSLAFGHEVNDSEGTFLP